MKQACRGQSPEASGPVPGEPRAPRTYPRWIEIKARNVHKKSQHPSQVLYMNLVGLHRLRAFVDSLSQAELEDLQAALHTLEQDISFWYVGRDKEDP